MTNIVWLAIIAGLFMAIAWVLSQVVGSKKAESSPEYPFQRKAYLLSKAERSFLTPLERAVNGEFRICMKVRQADVLQVRRAGEKRQSHQNKINSKHFDFVLCSLDDVRPLVAIELDDASHQRQSRRDRDEFVDRACKAAGLPLVRVTASRAYNPNDLRAQIQQSLAQSDAQQPKRDDVRVARSG